MANGNNRDMRPIPFPAEVPPLPHEPGFSRPPREREPSELDRHKMILEELILQVKALIEATEARTDSVNGLLNAVEERTDVTEKRTDAVLAILKKIAEVVVNGQSPLDTRIDAIADIVLRLIYEEMLEAGREVSESFPEGAISPPPAIMAEALHRWAKGRIARAHREEQR